MNSKYKISSNNLYERLGFVGVTYSSVSIQDIKDAFFDAVKIYPPQKEADKFKLISRHMIF